MGIKLPASNITEQKHIFISYSSTDRAFVDRLAEDLRVRGHVVWIDFEGIRGGDRWKQSIADGLHASRVVLLVLSPESIVSEWVEEEMATCLRLQSSRDVKIIPLLLRAVKDIAQPNIAEVYKEIQYIDFTEGYQYPFERLLEDLPEPEKGVPGHCQKIIAELAAAPWGLDHYIQGEAKILPIDASPYEGGMVKKQRENLLHHLRQNQRTIVLGEPGVGKSVALERLAWELAGQLIVPIRVKLLQYDGESLLKWLRLDLVRQHEIELDDLDDSGKFPKTRKFLKEPKHKFYFLLDGLNEVRPEHRGKIITEIEQLALEYKHPLVVTSRVQDDSWRRLRGAGTFQHTWVVQTITDEQARGYLAGHLGAEDTAVLWQQLDERMRGLVQTPLLLWLLKEAWREAREYKHGSEIRMPENRGELYQSFVKRMLTRDRGLLLDGNNRKHERAEALQRLALVMHHRQSLTISEWDALQIVDADVLKICKANGFLIGDDEALRFSPHQTIQEHFAAAAIRHAMQREGLTDVTLLGNQSLPAFMSDFVEPKPNYVDDPWWLEAFIQLAGLTDDPNQLAQQIAERNPWLAWWCVKEGKAVEPATRQAIEAQSIAQVNADDVRSRRQAAEALAKFSSERIAEPLAQLSVDNDESVSSVALDALLQLGEFGENATMRAFDQNVDKMTAEARVRWWRGISDVDRRRGVGLNDDGLPDIDWVEIPAGKFIYQRDEELELDTFYISRYPVTYRQFQAFIDAPDGFGDARWWAGLASDAKHRASPREQYFKYWNHPRERVSWYDGMAFCRWLSYRLTGVEPDLDAVLSWAVRLPTEQEWEKAAAGPDGLIYPYGNDFDAAKGNTRESGIGSTSAVGLYPDGASPYGVLDMSGNVWEWCLTSYSDGDNQNMRSNASRVLRGGSFSNYRGLARCGTRLFNDPRGRSLNCGLRFVVACPPS